MVSSETTRCVFVTTNYDTRLGLLLENDVSVSVFKEKICKEHEECFPNFGKINIPALKVNWGDQYYHLPDSMILSQAFQAMSNNNNASSFLLSVDVEKTAACSNLTKVAEEKTKKRKMKTSVCANKSQKKLALGDVIGEVQAFEMSPPQAIKEACPVSNLEASSQAEEKKSSEDHIHHSNVANNEGPNKDHVDATSENWSREKNTNTLLLMAVGNEAEMGTKDNGEIDADEATKDLKSAKKIRTKKGKTPAKEDASSSGNVEPDVVTRDQQDNVDKIVKKSSKKSNKKPS